MSQGKQRMCVVNPELVDDIGHLVGGQCEIMTRIGISWNSWIKITNGLPLRQSLALRFKARVLATADRVEGFHRKFPSKNGGLDHAALDDAFLLPSAGARTDSPVTGRCARAATRPENSRGANAALR